MRPDTERRVETAMRDLERLHKRDGQWPTRRQYADYLGVYDSKALPGVRAAINRGLLVYDPAGRLTPVSFQDTELLQRERDEERERFHRHVETMIEPKLLEQLEALQGLLVNGVAVASHFMDSDGRGDLDGWISVAQDVLASFPATGNHPRVVVDFDEGTAVPASEAPPFQSERVPNPAGSPDGPEYDERTSELDVVGAEAGWTGAPDPAREPNA